MLSWKISLLLQRRTVVCVILYSPGTRAKVWTEGKKYDSRKQISIVAEIFYTLHIYGQRLDLSEKEKTLVSVTHDTPFACWCSMAERGSDRATEKNMLMNESCLGNDERGRPALALSCIRAQSWSG